jgi:hypothetical protein
MTRPDVPAFQQQPLNAVLPVDVHHDDVVVRRRDAAVDDEPVAGEDPP